MYIVALVKLPRPLFEYLLRFAKPYRQSAQIPHIVTTSYLTHEAIERHLRSTGNYGHDGPVILSRGQSIGQRMVPMTRDLTFLWEE